MMANARIAADPTDPQHVIVAAEDLADHGNACLGNANVTTALAVSHDGGAARTTSDFAPPPLSQYPCLLQPSVTFDSAGHAWAAGWAASDIVYAVWVAESLDGGATWTLASTTPASAAVGGILQLNTYGARLAADPIRPGVVVTWIADPDDHFGDSEVMVTRCITAADCITTAIATDTSGITGVGTAQGVHAACPAFTPDGVLHLVWYDRLDRAIHHVASGDGGITFTPDVVAISITRPTAPTGAQFIVTATPSCAADPSTGALVVAWADGRAGGSEILASLSVDGGASWNSPVVASATTKAYGPSVASVGGELRVAYVEADAVSGLDNVELARSATSGITWTRGGVSPSAFNANTLRDDHHRVVEMPTDLAASASATLVAWTDASDAQSIWVANR